jgi:uncharacterized protein YacL
MNSIEKEIKQKTKLDNLEKTTIGLCIIAMISNIISLVLSKNPVWALSAILWVNLIIEKYCNSKIKKLDDLQKNVLLKLISNQNKLIIELEEGKKDENKM